MNREYNVAVVGATGAVGETILEVLAERDFPVATLSPLASSRSAGNFVRFKDESIEVQDLAEFDFSKCDIALFSAGGSISEEFAPKAAAAGAVVIDNTSHFRYDADVPLVVPEVNREKIADYQARGIIANPNCSTIQMLVALKPIHDEVGISAINVATYQAVSGSGKSAVSELISQSGELLNGRPVKPEVYPEQIAFNVLPHIDVFQDNGYTKEEMKMLWETQKILGDDRISVNATAVRVPVLYGHSEAVHVTCNYEISAEEVTRLLKNAPGVKVIDNPKKNKYPTPINAATGKNEVFVGRIRQDLANPKAVNLWVVADNIRKGAATNAVQIAEILASDYL